MKKIILLLAAIVLSGCVSHMSQQQCLNTNWQQEGFNDGSAGRMPRDLSRAAEDCLKFGIMINRAGYHAGWRQGARQYCTPDFNTGYADGSAGRPEGDIFNRTSICQQAGVRLNLSQYQAGRHKGLQLYCTYENGVNLARQGLPLPDVCPPGLREKFRAGWSSSKEQFCNNPANGFALGKANKPYPSICTPELYIAFKSEYDRGLAIGQRSGEGQARIDDLNRRISNKVHRYRLVERHGHYRLGRDKSPQAHEALDRVNAMAREKRHIEKDLFKLQVMG